MSYGLRSIAFVAELIHPPVQHDPRRLQKLHGELFASDACRYRDFRLVPGGAQLSNSAGGLPGTPVSCSNLLADRVQIREEQTGLSRDEFQLRLADMAGHVLRELPVRSFLAQQFAVRSVVNVHSGNDTRALMLRTVFGFEDAVLQPFGAAPTLAGLRLAFPPDEQHGGIFNVRIESYAQDPRCMFLENVGTFGQPVGADALDQLAERFSTTYLFVQDRLVEFVSQFDSEEPG